MSAFDDVLAFDAAAICQSEFSESITYTPVNDIGIQMDVVVERGPAEKTGGTPRQLSKEIRIHVQRALLPNAPVLGGDKVFVTNDDKTYTVTAILEENHPSIWVLVIN